MKVSKVPGLGDYGIYIDGVDFSCVSDEEWMEIGRLHLKNLVTIIRDINLDPNDYPGWIQKFGPTRFSLLAYLQKLYQKSFPDLLEDVKSDGPIMTCEHKEALKFGAHVIIKTNNNLGMQRIQVGYDNTGYPLGLFPDGELGWHTNEAGILTATPGVSLLGHTNMVGSATCFLQTADYYQSMSESFRSELNDMILLHRPMAREILGDITSDIAVNILNLNNCWADDTEIPMVMTSPGGIRGLHYTSKQSVYRIKDMSLEDSQRVFAEIDRHVFSDKYMFEHWYSQDNDLLLFDNSITLHRRLGGTDGRVAFRIQHDYSSLLDDFWQPYQNHGRMARRYIKEIQEIVRLQNIQNFKRPGIRHYLQTFF